LVIIHQNIIQQKFISMLDHTMFTWINPPLSYQELSRQALGKGVQKTRADIVTMNAALSEVFLANLPKSIRDSYGPICMGLPNTVFLHMFDWFIKKYGVTTAEEIEENGQ
jgi:hypothetical protein